MSIPTTCGSCGKSFRVKDVFAGRRARCPACAQSLVVPGRPMVVAASTPAKLDHASRPAQSTVPPAVKGKSRDPNALMREILSAFQGDFERGRPTLTYRLGLIVVAVTMVILPLVYVALVALAAYGVYYHATENTWLIRARFGRASLLLYFGPLLAGVLLLPFLVKPLFARSSGRKKTRELRFTEEPLVHSFVQRLCAAVGAPVPRRIDVNCAVNASASFRGGLLSLVSRDFVLTIGLPLVAGMTMRQLAGVLAHELGHFSQGAGMRVQFLVRSINTWFYRVVYEEDEWDDFLDSLIDDDWWGLALIGLLAKLLVGISRWILWVLMILGHGISCFMSRQMEFDADRYEARLAGSESFAGTTRRLHELAVAEQFARHLLIEDAYGGPIPKDFPTFIDQMSRELPPPVQQFLRELRNQKATGWFATHPSDADRIASAEREKAPGIFHLERPARLLFSDFEELAASVSPRFYKRAQAMTALPGSSIDSDAARVL